MGYPTALPIVILDNIPEAMYEIKLNRDKQSFVVYEYPCSLPSDVYIAVLRYFLGTLCSPLQFSGSPVLKTFSALDAVGRFDLIS